LTGKPPQRPGRKQRRGGLDAEDRALWDRVTRDATPLHPVPQSPARQTKESSPAAEATKVEIPRPEPVAQPGRRRVRPTGSGKPPGIGFDLVEAIVGPVGRPEAGLDRRLAERLRRGDREPDGRIDLHGLSAERAHRALDRRIGDALARGERLVLVITGKGGKRRGPDDAPFMRDDIGVLRQQVPAWLRSGPHAREIVGIYEAHLRHGGGGAFYVYLKKRR
jgi:DNA-nicking Smr family endonuclease